jgi:predicted regulator of Ras-like GTPase activity (Roadblock/LC7/MglB family)
MDADFERRCRELTRELTDNLDGAIACLVCRVDGIEIAHAQRRPVDVARLAAVASSLGALGDVASREAGIGSPRCVLVDSSMGRLLVRCMGRGEQAVIVALLTDAQVMLGQAWAQLRQAEGLLEGQPA